MKSKKKNIINRLFAGLSSDNGYVTVEASFVFPIMFFVLLFIIFIGNTYYEQSKIESIVAENAVRGASYIVNPNLMYIDKGKHIPATSKDIHVDPYRYLDFFSSGDAAEREIETRVKNEIKGNSLVLFNNQNVQILSVNADYDNKVLYSKFVVQVHYEIKFPIRFIFENDPTILKISARSEVSVSDSAEFVRNADMVVDLLEDTKLGETISGIFSKINEFISKFSG